MTSIDVSLKEDSARVDEVVVVGYGTMKRASITGAVSQIDGKELLKAPMGNVTNMLGGRVAGVVALQQSGQPGSDGASILVRGSGAKYIVDGVARDFSQIDPNDIESVSVLKDASSAAIYGMDASAVIIVTTKRGKAAPAKISYTGTFGLSQNAVMLEMLDGPGYAYWYNKAREMDGDTPIFTQRQIDMMLNGDPSDGWGNTNWYEKTFGTGYNQSHNLNVTGGNERIKYFTSIGYFDQEGNVKNFSFDRINIRSNIEAKIAKNWTMAVDLAGRVQRSNRPGFSGDPADWNNIAQQAMRAHPYVPENYNGLPVSTNTSSATVSPLASSEESGYAKSNTFYFQSNVSLKYDFPFLKGLSAKFMVAYDYSQTYSKIYSTPFRTMVATLPTTLDGNISYAENWDSRKKSENSLTEGLTRNTQITTNASLNYANTFGKHNVSAILLMETYSNDGNNFSAYGEGFSIKELAELKYASIPDKMSINGMSSVARKAGFAARVNYDYANKYLVELSCRYDGSYLFGGMVDGKRWSPFPAASVGWRISNEPWFDSKAIDNLKLRASIGLTGTTGISAYSYLNTLGFLDTPAVVLGGVGVDGMLTSSLANENLTWAKNLQYNGGFDLSMWGGRLGVEFDV
ncbi:SusC/RagA family TonB-linked outer membrane protein, partial [Alistipes shahii]